MSYPADILKLVDDVQSAFASLTIDSIDSAWDHFARLESYVELTWPHEKATMETCRRLKTSLSQYTRDVREKMPSPLGRWRVDLGTLRGQVSPRFDANGYPL